MAKIKLMDIFGMPMNDDISILMEFLNMPLQSSQAIFEKFATVNGAEQRGSRLEQFLYIEGTRTDKVLLVAHADTVWDEYYGSSDYKSNAQELIFHNGIIHNKNGGLGADDRAGCAIIWLLKDMGHSILITDGEECGLRGSTWLMNHNSDIAAAINDNHQFIIQFDRCNGEDFKCYSVGTSSFRCYIQKATNYTEPDLFSSTDIITLCRKICGVNLSIGYHNEHTPYEFLHLMEWTNTLAMCRKWLAEPIWQKFYLP